MHDAMFYFIFLIVFFQIFLLYFVNCKSNLKLTYISLKLEANAKIKITDKFLFNRNRAINKIVMFEKCQQIFRTHGIMFVLLHLTVSDCIMQKTSKDHWSFV